MHAARKIKTDKLNVLVRKNHGQTVTDATEGRADGKIILKMIQTSGIN
jgi:hypothetical protein